MISIVVPAYNEEKVIKYFIEEYQKHKSEFDNLELVVVNDGSSDSTPKIVNSYLENDNSIRLINHDENKGLGKALETGLNNAKGDIVVTMDSDLTHPFKLIPKLITEIKDKNYDVCIASRYVKGGGMKNVPAWRIFISKVVNNTMRLIYWTKVKDITAGYKAYKKDKIQNIHIARNGFESQIEIMVKLMRKKAKFKEIPLILKTRTQGESKFNLIKMGRKYIEGMYKLFFDRWGLR